MSDRSVEVTPERVERVLGFEQRHLVWLEAQAEDCRKRIAALERTAKRLAEPCEPGDAS